jgi:hypothetical protein
LKFSVYTRSVYLKIALLGATVMTSAARSRMSRLKSSAVTR